MTNVLTAMHLVDASMMNIDAPSGDSLYKYGTGRYLAMFKRYHSDSVQFRRSMKYYPAHPDIMETMYEQVMKNLQEKQDSINKILQPKTKNALPRK